MVNPFPNLEACKNLESISIVAVIFPIMDWTTKIIRNFDISSTNSS